MFRKHLITAAGLIILLIVGSCKNTDLITIKNAEGKITERYSVDENSKKHGEYESYINGVLVEKSTYVHGVLNGERKLYHTNGAIEIIETYKDNVIVGTYKTFYHTGVLSQEAEYADGVMQGTLKTYYKSGALKDVVTMVNNEENGPFKEYYENGNLQWEGQFLNGDNEFGLLKNYNEEGVLVKKMNCDSLAICTTIWTLAEGEVNLQNKK